MPEYQTIENKLKAQLTKVVAGRKLLLGVYDPNNFDEFGNAKLLAVAGQQGLTLNREGDTIDTTSKSGGGWMEQIKGLKEWSIDMDGIYVTEDDSHDKLIELYNSDEGLVLIVIYNAVTKDVMAAGLALLSSYPIEAPYDDVTTYSASFTGTGQLLSGKEIESVNGGDVEDPYPEDPNPEDPNPEGPYPEDPDPEDPYQEDPNPEFTGPLIATTIVNTRYAGDGRIEIEVELNPGENDVTSITDPEGNIHRGFTETPETSVREFGDPEYPHVYRAIENFGWSITWNLPKAPESLGEYQFIIEGNGGQTETVTVIIDESHIVEPERTGPLTPTTFVNTFIHERVMIEVELDSWENAVTSITDPDGTIHKGVAEDGPIYDAHDFGDPEYPHTYTVQSWGWRIVWNLPKTPESLGEYQFIIEGNGGQTETVIVTIDESHLLYE